MKKYLFLLLIASQSLHSFAQKNGDEPYMTKSLDASIKKVDAQTSGGNISLEGVSSNTRIEVYIRGNNGNNISKEEIEERLKNYEFTVDASNGKLTAVARNKDRKWDWKKALSISFKIYAPKSVTSDLSTSGGNIALSTLDGDQRFRTSGGNLAIESITGNVDGETSGGNIIIDHSTSDNISLSTSGGNIEASDCSGKINMSTSGGNIRLDNLKGNVKSNTSGGNIHGDGIEGALQARTSGGNVNLDNLSGSVETATSGGSMNIRIVKLGDYVRVDNSGGSIDLELPKNSAVDLYVEGDKIRTGTLHNFSGNTEDDKINGKVNGGGIPVTVKTSGRVNLSL